MNGTLLKIKMTEKAYVTGSSFPPLKEGKLRLYSMRFCPFAQRARLVLAFKKIPYETINISLKEKPDWFLEKNPKGMVPVLEQDGRIIYESLIVAEYLDTVYPSPRVLVSNDPYRRARDAMLIDFYGNKYVPSYYKIIFSEGKETDAAQVITQVLEELEKELTEKKSTYFGGEKPAFVDFMIWPWLERLPCLTHFNSAISLTSFSSLHQWRAAMLEEPAVRECLLDTEVHLKFYQSTMGGDLKAFDTGLL